MSDKPSPSFFVPGSVVWLIHYDGTGDSFLEAARQLATARPDIGVSLVTAKEAFVHAPQHGQRVQAIITSLYGLGTDLPHGETVRGFMTGAALRRRLNGNCPNAAWLIGADDENSNREHLPALRAEAAAANARLKLVFMFQLGFSSVSDFVNEKVPKA
jgi:hypothetical protein